MAFGTYKEVVSARATDKAIQKVAQDGGIVSALLCYALEFSYLFYYFLYLILSQMN